MAKNHQPKVECRARTGGNYSRAGHRWTGEYVDVPLEILADKARTKAIFEDPHLEIKVDGKYATGPRAKKRGDSDPAPIPEPGEQVAALRETIDELDGRISQLETALEKSMDEVAKSRAEASGAKAEAEAAKKQAADLGIQLEAAKKAASKKAPETSTSPTDPTASPKDDSTAKSPQG